MLYDRISIQSLCLSSVLSPGIVLSLRNASNAMCDSFNLKNLLTFGCPIPTCPASGKTTRSCFRDGGPFDWAVHFSVPHHTRGLSTGLFSLTPPERLRGISKKLIPRPFPQEMRYWKFPVPSIDTS